MPTNNGDATGNRRSRTNGDDATDLKDTHGGFAASAASARALDIPTDLSAALGARLAPMKEILALQPDELKGTLISKSKEMLDLVTTIRQRQETFGRFSQPWINPKTQQPYVNEETNEPKPFIPNSLRIKCPIKASDTYNDDPDIQAKIRLAQSKHEQYQKDMAEYAKDVAELEITRRKKDLHAKFFDFVVTFALGRVIIKEIKDGGIGEASKLDRNELSLKSAFDALKDLSEPQATSLMFEKVETMLVEFKSVKNFDDAAVETKMDVTDSEFIKPIMNNLHTWIPQVTAEIWNKEAKKETDRKINAALRKTLKTSALTKQTEDIAMALESATATSQDVMAEYIRKEARKEAKKIVQQATKSERKKSLGGAKNHASMPTEGGRKQRRGSAKSPKKSKKRQSDASEDYTSPAKKQKKQKQPESILKKGKHVKFSNSSRRRGRQQDTESRGSRGGSSGGGKGKGAGRR